MISLPDLRSKDRKGLAGDGTEREIGDGGESGRWFAIACSSSEIVCRFLRLMSLLNTGDLGEASMVRSLDLARPNFGDTAKGTDIDETFNPGSTGALSKVNASASSSCSIDASLVFSRLVVSLRRIERARVRARLTCARSRSDKLVDRSWKLSRSDDGVGASSATEMAPSRASESLSVCSASTTGTRSESDLRASSEQRVRKST